MAKVIFINRYFYPDYSATSQLLTDLAFHLASTGENVWVITSRQTYDDSNARLPAHEQCQGVKIIRVWTSRFGRQNLLLRFLDYLTFYLSAVAAMLKIVRRDDILAAMTDPPLISVAAYFVVKLRQAKLINWVQDLFPEVATALDVRGISFVAPVLRWLRNRSLISAQSNVVLGQKMAQRIANEGVNNSEIAVIHNWSDGSKILPIPRDTNSLRHEWGIADKFVVGYSGNMGRAHDFVTLLDTAEKLRSSSDLLFLFIGGGARRSWLEAETARRALTNVKFMPYQPRDRLPLSLGVPDVHVISLLPGLEGLIVPSKFYGIAAAGRPVLYIGTETGDIPAIIRKAECGITVNLGDASGAANGLSRLASDRECLSVMGSNARSLFDSSFDMRVALLTWKKLVQSVKEQSCDR